MRGKTDAVLKLYYDLEKTGLGLWLDKKPVRWADLELKIRNAIKNSKYFIALLSTTSVQKRGHIQKELKYAKEVHDEIPENQIWLIPCRLDKCEIPYILNRTNLKMT